MLEISHIVWNLFLAFIPVVLSGLIGAVYVYVPRARGRWWVWWPLGILWLGFLPNTAYLLTEWRHFLEYVVKSPAVVQAAAHNSNALLSFLGLATFYVVYSGCGLLAFSMSIWPISRICKPGIAAKAVFFFLCALGVYLGLIRRLNTWDLIYHPRVVLTASIDAATHPVTIALAFGFAAVLWFNFWVFEVFVDGLRLRIRQLRAGRVRHA